MFASSGERGEPCGMPRRLSRASVERVFRPRSSVSSTGQSSHILIRCEPRADQRSGAPPTLEVGMRNAPEVVREVGVHDFRMAAKQQLLHLYGGLLGVTPSAGGGDFPGGG